MSVDEFKRARSFLLANGADYEAAYRGFRWPRLSKFNWAIDWFDAELAEGSHASRLALVILGESVERQTFGDLSRASSAIANSLNALGATRGDRLLLMLNNIGPLWETMLAAMKLGLVVIPATTLLAPDDIADRLQRGAARFIVAEAADVGKFAGLADRTIRIAVGEAPADWLSFAALREASPAFSPEGETNADDPFLLYFTSGTTARPKLVLHSHQSYPVGHLTTMFGLGLKPGDVHLNISSPGWAKHAWSSFFAPWNAGATIVALNKRFEPRATLDDIIAHGVASFCAPPTVWRHLVQLDLAQWQTGLREVNSAGEPLNPEVIEQVRRAWGLTIRDSYGQTETTMMVGNSPSQPIKPGSMGRPLPGYRVVLADSDGAEGDQGEICIKLDPRPIGLMRGYQDDAGSIQPLAAALYRTGDVAARDGDGYITYIGRSDDVFKSSDYRLSPFELESALVEHEAVAEAAVVPAPDPMRYTVAKAYVALAPGYAPDRATALSIFKHVRARLAPFKRVRRLEFAELPKTISGKIRRVELRGRENELARANERAPGEFRSEDFSDLA
jgi:acetyl-CoA synthetase